MIAHHEVTVGGNRHFLHGSCIAVTQGDVVFAQGFAVEPHLAAVNAEAVAWERDDALDIALLWVAGVTEDNHVVPFDGRDVVDELVDKQAVSVLEAGQHAGSLDPDRLVEKGDDQDRGGGRDDEIADPEPQAAGFARDRSGRMR